MSTEENKALARRLIEEAWNQGNLATVDELLVPGHVGHHSLVPNQPPSRELYKQYIVRTRTAFPDFHATIEEQIAEGDLVVTRWSVQGTHQGMFRGHSPTGKQMTLDRDRHRPHCGRQGGGRVDGDGYPPSDATTWRDALARTAQQPGYVAKYLAFGIGFMLDQHNG